MDFPEPFLVVGCGSIGKRHLENLKEFGLQELVACDSDPTRLDAVSQTADISCRTLEGALRHEPAAAIIATPPATHVELAQQTILAGCHTLIEKPLSHNLRGLSSLETDAKTCGVQITVACNMRFHPGPQIARSWLKAGRIGEPIYGRFYTGSYLPRWRPGRDYRRSYSASLEQGGTILDCIHEIDLAQWVLGPASLSSASTRPAKVLDLETDGIAELLLAHKNDVLGSVHLNFLQRDYRRTIELVGTKGTIYWNFSDGEVQRYGPDGTLEEVWTQDPAWETNDMYKDLLREFFRTVNDESQSLNPISEAARTLAIALQARGDGS